MIMIIFTVVIITVLVRHHRYRFGIAGHITMNVYYGWSYYNPYYPIIHIIITTILIIITMEIIITPILINMEKFWACCATSVNSSLRSNTSTSVNGQGYSVQRQQPTEISVQRIITLKTASNSISNTTDTQNTSQQNKSSDF